MHLGTETALQAGRESFQDPPAEVLQGAGSIGANEMPAPNPEPAQKSDPDPHLQRRHRPPRLSEADTVTHCGGSMDSMRSISKPRCLS